MTNFAYQTGIPATNDNPSDDQPPMLINNDNNFAIWNEDHRGFAQQDGGTHRFQRYLSFSSPALLVNGANADEPSVAYPNAGGADPTRAQYYFLNSNNQYCATLIRSFGVFTSTGAPGPSIQLNNLNVISVVEANTPRRWIITMSPGAVIGSSAAVFINVDSSPLNFNFSYTLAANILTIFTALTIGTPTISFQVLQL